MQQRLLLTSRPTARSLSSAAAAAAATAATAAKTAVTVKALSGNARDALEVKPLPEAKRLQPQDVRLALVGAPVLHDDLLWFSRHKEAVGAPAGVAGVFQVTEVGSGVKDLKVGDRVAPATLQGSFGTWRSELAVSSSAVVKLPPSAASENAADIYAHAAALKLLDGVKSGSVVAVNGAQFGLATGLTAVGVAKGLRMVCIVGASVDDADTKNRLKGLGAEMVQFEGSADGTDYLGSATFRRVVQDLPGASVVINQVGGSVATDVARMLGPNGVMYTLSGAPLVLPNSLLVDRHITVKGWSLAHVLATSKPEDVRSLFSAAAESAAKAKGKVKTVSMKLSDAVRAADVLPLGGPTPVLVP